MPGGDVSSNCGQPWLHTNAEGDVIDVRIGFHFTPTTGSAWVSPPPIALPVYRGLFVAAWTSAAAFESAIAASPWGAWYAANYTSSGSKLTLRKLVATVEPRVTVAPVAVPP